ncbi:MAG: hypothetical protein MJA27_07290 [Pseudanabaenales cyanobacterium]|nr:hypothetical protein [Pseudanabaenales cyanobacterium]
MKWRMWFTVTISLGAITIILCPVNALYLPSSSEAKQPIVKKNTPDLPPLPTPVPDAYRPESSGIVAGTPNVNTPIGIGHLRPKDLDFFETTDRSDNSDNRLLNAGWLEEMRLPIYESPDGRHWGWIANGWLVPNGYEPLAIGQDVSFLMLHTYYSLFSFPVLEIRLDGWFRFQYSSAGTAWAHTSQLKLGELELIVESWQDRFLDVGWVYFRNDQVRHALRTRPGVEQILMAWIGNDSFIEPIEFRGDWMRVRVTQPVNGCEFLPNASTTEGWMRWRSAEQGAWIWYPTKGC